MRFAEFELDVAAGELLRNGRAVKLERIPMQLLSLLVSRPGELISRAEIIERLWGKGVFVDTDNGINTAIRKIRIALHDDSEEPRFVATLPGRGYRFIGDIVDESAVTPANVRPPEPTQSVPSPSVSAEPSVRLRGRIHRRTLFWAGSFLVCFAIIAGVVTWILAKRDRSHQGRVMVAVLPFVNLSGDSAQEYFADGMTEEMIAQLGSMNPATLGVIARTSAMHYKHTNENVSQIAQELGVEYLLEGSVRRAGNEVRVNAQLIQAKDQTNVWAHDYDRQMTNLLEIQTAIASAIAQQIRVTLPASKSRTTPINTEAYEAYLRGTQAMELRTKPGMITAIGEFTHAVTVDPHYASAWAALSRAYSLAPVMNMLPSNEAFPKAREAAMKAIAIDDNSPVAHCTLGFVNAHYDFDWNGAEREFQRAIVLNPSDPNSHLFYSNSFLSPQGRHEEALAEIKTALSLDPLSFPIQSFYGRTLVWAGHPNEAIAQFNKVTMENPNSPLEHVRLAHTYSYLGRYDEAIREEEEARILSGETPEAAVAKGQELRIRFHDEGARGYWRQELEFAKSPDNPPESFVGSYGIAILYAQLGEEQKAITALHQAFAERDFRLTEIGMEPLLASLHKNPSLIQLENQIGLPSGAH